MKLGPVTKLDKRYKTTSKKDYNDVMSGNCGFSIVIFPTYGQFGAIRKPDSGRIACETYLFNNSNLQKQKTELNNRFLTQLSHYCFK